MKKASLESKEAKTKEEMDTTKKAPPALVVTQGAGGASYFYSFGYSLFRCFLIQVECYESIEYIRYPYGNYRRYITIYSKSRSDRLEKDI